MVDQPSHRSYKIRGHNRQRKSSKPYSRPNEAKNKGLLDKVKDYLSPGWLFGYFSSNEDVEDNFQEDILDQNATVTHEEGSTSGVTQQARLDNIEEESDDRTFRDTTMDNVRDTSFDTNEEEEQVFTADDNDQDDVRNPDTTTRLSGSLNDDVEDENERRLLEQEHRPHQSVLPYSDQLKRKPLPSLLHSRSSTSLRATPSLRSQGNQLLGSLAARSNTYMPGTKISTSTASHASSFSSAQRPTTLFSRSSLLRDNNLNRVEPSKVAAPQKLDAMLTKSTSTLQTVPASNTAPLFSVEKFVTPVQRTFTNKRVGSPNYPGPVIYGGALNVSRDVPFKRRRMSSPGSESYHPVSKLRIRGVKEKTIQNSTVGGNGTRTAQRILDALESVSSPLKDARRIPSPISLASASPLSFTASKTRTTPPKTKVGPRVSYLQAKLLGEPPVSSLQTPKIAKTSFLEDPASKEPLGRQQHSSPPKMTLKNTVEDQSFFSGLKDTVLKSSLPTNFAPKSLPTSLSPIESTGRTSGKMKTAPRSAAMHYSSNKNSQESEVVNPLPEISNAVPLPLNPGKNMSFPMFSSNKIAGDGKLASNSENIANKQKETSARDKVLTESPKNGFIFSSPEAKSQRFSVKESLEMADNEVSFSFSDPVPVKKSSAASKETFFNPLLQSQKTSSSSKPMANYSSKSTLSVNPLSNDIGTGQAPPAKTPGKPEPAQTIDLTKRFAPAPGSWECGSCMLNNKPDAIKCVACEAPKPGKKAEKPGEDKHVVDWKTKFAPPKDSWECSTCLVRNKNDLSKCAACETPKPGTSSIVDLKAKFAPPVGSWECSTCMLQNKAGDLKCVSCETSKPGSSSGDDLKLKFAPPSGSWACPACMIRNQAADLKCVACETKKPGTENTVPSQSGVTFNNTSSSTSGFTFGGSGSASSTSSGFTFGLGDKSSESSNKSTTTLGQSSNESSKQPFTFGSNTATTTKSGFTFGATTSSETKSGSGFTFGGSSGEKSTTAPTFAFGANSPEKKSVFTNGPESVEKKTDQNGNLSEKDGGETTSKPSNTMTMNIAQAAAAGLLQVPGKDPTPSTSQAITSQATIQQSSASQPPSQASKTLPSFAPTFKFGASTAPSRGSGEQPEKTSALSFAPLSSSTGRETQPLAFQSSTTTAATPTGGLFTFGAAQSTAPVVTSSTAKPSATSLFSFTGSNPTPLAATTTTPAPNKAPFSFTASKIATTLPNAETTVPSLTTTNSASLFKFTGPSEQALSVKPTATSSQSTSLFSFTGSTATSTAQPPLFNFGAVNGPTTSNGPSISTGQSTTGLFSFTGAQPSAAPVVENQNSMGGEEMDADSNNNHDQATFPQVSGGFNFTPQQPGGTSNLFSAGSSGTPGGVSGGFNFNASSGIAPTFQFGTGNPSTPSGGFNFGAAAAPAGSSPFMFGGAPTPSSGTANPSAGITPFNFGSISSAPNKPQLSVPPNTDQPTMFNIGAQSTTPGNRVIRKAVRRNRKVL
ncbi:nuclear pore complex protein Nup153-like [Dendronephthya gigantea]|uniref:nuclear pore complex protein Nup153-like n=1 Tax=Dendronephthya gigantea TaxID=151771 RepID=UPI00106CF0F2|nr:nuclear pore complex protein Nup153-like [Dendronephthya gigantea]